MVLAVLAAETDISVRLRLDDVMATLIHVHGAMLVDRIEADAADNAALRWLLGGCCWWTGDKALEERLTAIADVDAVSGRSGSLQVAQRADRLRCAVDR